MEESFLSKLLSNILVPRARRTLEVASSFSLNLTEKEAFKNNNPRDTFHTMQLFTAEIYPDMH